MVVAATQAGPEHDLGLVRHLREGKFFAMPFVAGALHTSCLSGPLLVLTCLAALAAAGIGRTGCGGLAGRPVWLAAWGAGWPESGRSSSTTGGGGVGQGCAELVLLAP